MDETYGGVGEGRASSEHITDLVQSSMGDGLSGLSCAAAQELICVFLCIILHLTALE